jgi:hypothetical protein
LLGRVDGQSSVEKGKEDGVFYLDLYSQKLNFKFEKNFFQILLTSPKNSNSSPSESKPNTNTLSSNETSVGSDVGLVGLSSVDECINLINTFLEDLNHVNDKGYVTSTTIPISIFPLINTFFTKSLGYKGKIGSDERRIQLWVNFITINIYYLSLIIDKELQQNVDPLLEDQKADLKNLIQKLYSLLDPSIRIKIQKRGISVIQNIYTGYDSEFYLKDPRKHLNELLSLQLALNTRTIVKIPLLKPFEISYVHPLSSKVTFLANPIKSLSPLNIPSGEEEELDPKLQDQKPPTKNLQNVELGILESSISQCIEAIRSLKYKNHDFFLLELIETLKDYQGITFFEDNLKDQIVFVLPRTNLIKKIIYTSAKNLKDYSFEYLVKTSNLLANSSLKESYNHFIKELRSSMPSLQKVKGSGETGIGSVDIIKSRQRTTYNISPLLDSKTEVEKLSVSRVKNNYFCSHLTNADLSILSDFNTLKSQLDIVNKSFITLGKPLLIDNCNVHIRDTMLLAPAGNRSLESLGKLYSCNKLEISIFEKENMNIFLVKDRVRFEEYALQDAIITLKHAIAMEDFNIQLNCIGVPITLASLGRKYVLNKWSESLPPETSQGYQISNELLLGNSASVQTPKGLSAIGNIGLYISYYIANYKGGRNESFMYGVDTNSLWYDYDLISAYTTSMADLGLPSYSETSLILPTEIKE